jgi:hypothetical protein
MAANTQTTMTRPAPNLSISAPDSGAPTPISNCANAIASANDSRPTSRACVTGGRYSPMD